ncbi:hypothetical protein [Pseudomonas syringae]|uniref:Acyl carrier protein n=1 Tax=Pseudomonas syringae TaxID=317 RepID=A0A9Q4FGA4_PSESX|nr:hypothetical protein [Pseudomonas syringae]KTB85859.1 hypothetical protein AO070_15890 [Pseudomonas syringae pv. syringae PD2766]MCF5468019.1 hypothetical protein [Pseudomonas syringae]MCF5473007.1 hypothetical protein [Pseudomonas syringae]MCF5483022.1 hypothetical protein [Pseudomonas syringae]MCF5487443.1 hypothetical protein [Pseudomonas syringae]
MDRVAVRQSVFDELGIILVDKSEIREGATFEDLVLDEHDIERLFSALGKKFKVEFPDFMKAKPTALAMVVDMIMFRRGETVGDSKESGSEA